MSCKAKQKGARRTGWLSKRGGRIHTWHRRWFVLTGDLLFYYKTPQDSRPTGTIPLAGNRVIRHVDEQKQNGTFKFEIVAGRGQQISSTHNTYLISAESAEEADSWVTAVRRVVNEPYGGGMFGRSLEETMQVEARLGGSYVPILVHRCVRFIQEHGLKEVGIFRLPGQSRRVQALKELYDQGCQQEFTPTEDIHTVASLLKLYLRELPEPLVPFVYYSQFQAAMKLMESGVESVVEELLRLLLHLPRVNFNVMKYIVRFLHEVQEHSEQNKMTNLNLSTVFGPNFLQPQTSDPKLLMEFNNTSTDFVCIAIDQQWRLFPHTDDERPPKRLSIVMLSEENNVWLEKGKLSQHSLYNPQEGPAISKHTTGRRRQNSAPQPPPMETQLHAGKVASIVERFNHRTTKSTSNLLTSNSVEISSPLLVQHTAGQPPHTAMLSGLLASTTSSSSSSSPSHHTTSSPSHPPHHPSHPPPHPDELHTHHTPTTPTSVCETNGTLSSPEQHNNVSGFGLVRKHSDTLSSDAIVNTITREMESLELQLSVVQEECLRYKKSARLWKSRYDQERRARVSAEERVGELQQLVDDTFQQFALDDSELEDESSEGCSASGSAERIDVSI